MRHVHTLWDVFLMTVRRLWWVALLSIPVSFYLGHRGYSYTDRTVLFFLVGFVFGCLIDTGQKEDR